MANLLGRLFNSNSTPEIKETTDNNLAPANTSNGLTGVAKYLQQHQPAEAPTTTQQTAVAAAAQQVTEVKPTGVAKYVDNVKTATLTGVARYLVKQIIPEYQVRAAAAAKAAAPTGVEKYLSTAAAVALDAQPSVPTGVATYLNKLL
jgi:hypothetical protein